ncbi:hypothetical protein BGZ65_006207 [Modicella reniformis]|uniref:SET domain-containing protein n=1 Tax=Modicella reniformis TaxID=1440133 RepID=A0A9P6M8H5_9FUNG|nr:hypothetical protein BGZ65_006207 [Modicella reniformis]
MSAKLSSTTPSPSITNLAKVINRLTNTNNSNGSSNNNSNSNSNSNNSNGSNNSNNSNSHNTFSSTHSLVDGGEDDSAENEEDDEDAGIIRCICNFTDDDGYTIQCERCFVWQHAVCVGIGQSNVPDKYLCELCSPRPVDRKRANEIQRKRNGTLEQRNKREKSPPPKKTSVGRPRKQFGSITGSSLSEQGIPYTSSSSSVLKENGVHQSTGSGGTNGYQGKASSGPVDANVKKVKSNKQAPQHSLPQNHTMSTSSSHPHHLSSKHKTAGGPSTSSRISSATNDDDDLDMESDSQEDVLDAYQFEFSSIETNIVTSKAVQDLFRLAQSRKRSLSLTSGVKLQELVASNSTASNNASTPPIPESPDPSPTTLASPQQPPAPPSLTADSSNVVSMERESLARPLMKTTVKHILPSKSSHSPAPQYGLFAESNIGAGRFMMEFKGEVSLKSAYKADPINQYSILAAPKPFVLFHPQLNLVVDARRSGNDARFVRRSCMPNTEIKSIVVPGVQDHTVHLGLFAKVPIGKGQEITLDWDWNTDHPALQAIKLLTEKSKDSSTRKSLKDIRKAKYLVASTFLPQTDCACENKETCVLHQMLKDGISEAGTRDDSSTSAKGNRPKKTNPESLRQRYGQRDRPDGKRSADQDTSDEELSVGEASPRHKSPKAVKHESSSKKARHDAHSYQRSVRTEQDLDSDSGSDDDRRRKQAISDRQGSPSKRSNAAGQEMSTRETKQAALLHNKKLEDRDALSIGHAKQKSQDLNSLSPQQKRIGTTSLKARARDKPRLNDTDQKSILSSNKKENNAEDGDISIGDSGIDSDSNNGTLRKDPFSSDQVASSSSNKRPLTIQSQGELVLTTVRIKINHDSHA